MGWMIPDSKLLLDQYCHSRCGPDRPAKPVVLGTFLQQIGQLGALLSRKSRLRARRRLMTQRLGSLRLGFFDPLTHGSFRHAESVSDIFLFPTLFVQLPAAQSSAFAPIFGKRFFLAHTSFHRLASFTPLGPHAEVNNKTCHVA